MTINNNTETCGPAGGHGLPAARRRRPKVTSWPYSEPEAQAQAPTAEAQVPAAAGYY